MFVDFRLRGEPRRVAVLADRLDLRERHAGDRGGPGIDSIAFLLAHRTGFAGEHGLVKLKPPRVQNLGIGRHLLPRADPHQIPQHDIRRWDLEILAATTDKHRRGDQDRQAVERHLRPQFGDDADAGVDDDDQPEHRVLPRPGEQNDHHRGEDNRVEQGEHVRADDRAHRAGRTLVRTVGLALFHTGLHGVIVKTVLVHMRHARACNLPLSRRHTSLLHIRRVRIPRLGTTAFIPR